MSKLIKVIAELPVSDCGRCCGDCNARAYIEFCTLFPTAKGHYRSLRRAKKGDDFKRCKACLQAETILTER